MILHVKHAIIYVINHNSMSLYITANTRSLKLDHKELLTSIKEKLQVLNTCLQNNWGRMNPDAFSELVNAMDDILKELDNEQ